MSQAAPVVCPVCGRNDQIQKVRAIVSSGTTTITAQGAIPPAQASSELSRRLAPPELQQPPAPSLQSLDYFRESAPVRERVPLNERAPEFGCSTFIIAGGLILFVLYVVGDVIDQFVRNPGLAAFWGGLAAAGVILGIPVLVAWLWRQSVTARYAAQKRARDDLYAARRKEFDARKKEFDERHAEGNTRKSAFNEQEEARWRMATAEAKSRWQSATTRWNDAYYCHRDDVVFVPPDTRAVPPERMMEVLR